LKVGYLFRLEKLLKLNSDAQRLKTKKIENSRSRWQDWEVLLRNDKIQQEEVIFFRRSRTCSTLEKVGNDRILRRGNVDWVRMREIVAAGE
jgi:hypothetical protein